MIIYKNWNGYANCEKFRNSKLKVHENEQLYLKAKRGAVSPADLDAYEDGASIAIGYGFDLLVRDNAEINDYFSSAGRSILTANDAQRGCSKFCVSQIASS